MSVLSMATPPRSAAALTERTTKDEDKPIPIVSSPPRLPQVAVPPSTTSTPTQPPAQLALMLSDALSQVETLKKALSEQKRLAARAERVLQTFHPSTSIDNGISDEQKNEQMSQGALKAVLDAETRAEGAERARDDALHALKSLSAHFAELERYESSLSLRAADARSALTRLLTNITSSYPPPASSPTLPGSPLALSLPALPSPLPAPSLNSVPSQSLSTVGAPPLPSSLIRHMRGLPSHTTPSVSYSAPSHSHGAGHVRQSSLTHGSTFSSLPLPPPPSASGLGSGLFGALSAPSPSASSSFSVPVKRSHRSRSIRDLDGAIAEPGIWEEPKRRRVGNWDVDVDEPHAEQPLPYPHQTPLSAQATQRVFEHDRERLQHQQSYARNGAPHPPRYEEQREVNVNAPVNANGMVRLDARELVRDAKERERREGGLYHRSRDGDSGRRGRRSASRSSARSSRSIDEMLLETATDGDYVRKEGGRPSPIGLRHEQQGLGQAPSHGCSQVPLSSSHSSHPSTGSIGGINGAAEKEKPGKVPATNLVTLGPGGVVVSGGGQAASAPIPGGGFPAHNAAGQRMCRQCGAPGRYKDGKCVEKWGPGPEGPGTVCDRCRKKMKRVERRGTLDSTTAAAQQQALLTRRQSQAQLPAQPSLPPAPSQSQSQNRASMRSDTLILEPTTHNQTQSNLHHLEHEEKVRNSGGSGQHRGNSGRSRSPGLRRGQTHSQSHGHAERRGPTPPHITSISTREQDDGGDAVDVDEDERDGDGDLDVDAELARAAEVVEERKSVSRSTATYSSSSSNGSIVVPTGSPHKPRSSSRASSASTTTAYDRDGSRKGPHRASNGMVSSKRMPLPSVATLPRPVRRRNTQDELDEDDADVDMDVDADGSRDVDPDVDIMDAVDASMKDEE